MPVQALDDGDDDANVDGDILLGLCVVVAANRHWLHCRFGKFCCSAIDWLWPPQFVAPFVCGDVIEDTHIILSLAASSCACIVCVLCLDLCFVVCVSFANYFEIVLDLNGLFVRSFLFAGRHAWILFNLFATGTNEMNNATNTQYINATQKYKRNLIESNT